MPRTFVPITEDVLLEKIEKAALLLKDIKDIVERIQPKGKTVPKFKMDMADNIKITTTTDGSMFCFQPTLSGDLSGAGIMMPRSTAAKLAKKIVEML